MSKDAFESIMRGLNEAKAFMDGERTGCVVHTPVNIKALRAAANMTQAAFAETYRLPIGTVREWEQGRRQPDAPARALLRLIERDPKGVAEMLA